MADPFEYDTSYTGYSSNVTSTTSYPVSHGYRTEYSQSTARDNFYKNIDRSIKKKFERLQMITDTKKGWTEKYLHVQSHKRRSNIQLRGVSFNGLGWA